MFKSLKHPNNIVLLVHNSSHELNNKFLVCYSSHDLNNGLKVLSHATYYLMCGCQGCLYFSLIQYIHAHNTWTIPIIFNQSYLAKPWCHLINFNSIHLIDCIFYLLFFLLQSWNPKGVAPQVLETGCKPVLSCIETNTIKMHLLCPWKWAQNFMYQ